VTQWDQYTWQTGPTAKASIQKHARHHRGTKKSNNNGLGYINCALAAQWGNRTKIRHQKFLQQKAPCDRWYSPWFQDNDWGTRRKSTRTIHHAGQVTDEGKGKPRSRGLYPKPGVKDSGKEKRRGSSASVAQTGGVGRNKKGGNAKKGFST